MQAARKRKTYCVWRNEDDVLIALDETAPKCAELMGVTLAVFYQNISYPRKGWTVMLSTDLDGDDKREKMR